MHSRLRQLLAMSRRTRHAVMFTAFAIPVVRMTLACGGLARAQKWLSSSRLQHARDPHGDWHVAQELCRGAAIASARVRGGQHCLTRSLALRWLLQRNGFAASLRIGADKVDGSLAAHAWVELDGRPLNEPAGVAARGVLFDEPPANTARAREL